MKIKLPSEREISFIALIISLIALITSLINNSITANQALSRIIVSDVSFIESDTYQYSTGWERYYYCKNKVQLINQGGADTDIIKFQVNISYKDKVFTSRIDTENQLTTHVNFLDGFDIIQVRFIKPGISSTTIWVPETYYSKEVYPDLPIKLPGYNTVNLNLISTLQIDSRLVNFYGSNVNWSIDPNSSIVVDRGYKPIEFSYIFYTSANQKIITTKTPCFLIRENPDLQLITKTPRYWWTSTPYGAPTITITPTVFVTPGPSTLGTSNPSHR